MANIFKVFFEFCACQCLATLSITPHPTNRSWGLKGYFRLLLYHTCSPGSNLRWIAQNKVKSWMKCLKVALTRKHSPTNYLLLKHNVRNFEFWIAWDLFKMKLQQTGWNFNFNCTILGGMISIVENNCLQMLAPGQLLRSKNICLIHSSYKCTF